MHLISKIVTRVVRWLATKLEIYISSFIVYKCISLLLYIKVLAPAYKLAVISGSGRF